MVMQIDDFGMLLTAAASGDSRAWEALYDGHAPAVLGLLRARRIDQPEDALADVWLDVVRSLSTFTGDERAFRGWILRIAHNRGTDRIRAAVRRPEISLAVVPDVVDDTSAGAFAGSDDWEGLLAGLSEPYRVVLYLRFVLDLSLPDIASVLDLSGSAVKMRLQRALQAASQRMTLEGAT
jgi:RNA polymerase sigma-70 factor (ECF subfamily)